MTGPGVAPIRFAECDPDRIPRCIRRVGNWKGLVLGVLARIASVFGMIYMLALLFSSNFPVAHVQFWQYFAASLDHSGLALCFLAFIVGRSDERLSARKILSKQHI
jgi:hypothetical protein